MTTKHDPKIPDAAYDDDLYRGQRSSEVKCGKLYATTTIFV